jgi:glucose/mannose transport system substrate-binding protein
MVPVAVGACADPAGPPRQIEILTWWSAPGERDAMTALRNQFMQNHTNEPLKDAPEDESHDLRVTLQHRMIEKLPPDTFQANGGWDLFQWVLFADESQTENKMFGLDELATSEGWKDMMPPAVLDTVRVNGQIYAVPLDVHRTNTLFFNPDLFAQAGVPPPDESTTLDELFARAEALAAGSSGITPFALGTSKPAWPLPILLFENLLVARQGAAYYRSFFCGAGDPQAPEIATAVNDLAHLVSLSNGDRLALTWDASLNLLLDGHAAMAIMGDWAKGYFMAKAAASGSPQLVQEIPTPGTSASGSFIFTVDTFGLPSGAQNHAGAIDFLKLVGSQAGQDAFNPLKGSTSPRTDSDRSDYDATALATRDAFLAVADDPARLAPATTVLARQEFMDTLNDVLGNFTDSSDPNVNGNASIVIDTLTNWYDVLQTRSAPGLCP